MKQSSIAMNAKTSAREQLIWSMTVLIVALVGTVALKAIYIVIAGRLSTELVKIISRLIGSFTTPFMMENKL